MASFGRQPGRARHWRWKAQPRSKSSKAHHACRFLGNVSELFELFRKDFNPVSHRRAGAGLQMLNATDVSRDNGVGMERLELLELAIAQLYRQLALQNGIRAG